MAQTCPRCSRANPAEALFCYHDGNVLGNTVGSGALAGPRFPMPFVFPSGRACHSYDELAHTCFDDWPAALDVLQHGLLASFFAGLGRADLVQTAREAGRVADRDEGLNRLLSLLPTKSLAPPRLFVEPTQVHLGVLRVGEDTCWELRLGNQGLGLVQGSITCEGATWLALGDSGASRKVFQFLHDFAVSVHVRGKELRAATRPLEARLQVVSSGGSATVNVRAEVPPAPFPEGPLAGALTPRQLAEKAKGAPKDAARWFENGAVVRWYGANGWAYPVEGPPASGLAAIQQFFEALGVTKPPHIEIGEPTIHLEGAPGARLRHVLRVTSPEKRHVFAHALADQPWLSVSEVELTGRNANVHLVVQSVPDQPGQVLRACVTVTANGRQRFVVPVTLEVSGGPRVVAYGATRGLPEPNRQGPVEALPAEAIRPLPLPEPPPAIEARLPPIAVPAPQPPRAVPVWSAPPEPAPALGPAVAPSRANLGGLLMPLLPVLFLVLGLFVTAVHDLGKWARARPSGPPPAKSGNAPSPEIDQDRN